MELKNFDEFLTQQLKDGDIATFWSAAASDSATPLCILQTTRNEAAAVLRAVGQSGVARWLPPQSKFARCAFWDKKQLDITGLKYENGGY